MVSESGDEARLDFYRAIVAALLIFAGVCTPTLSARAALLSKDIASVVASPQLGAQLPLDVLLSEDKNSAPLRKWLDGRPSVWVIADFTCQSLCSPVLRTMADALNKTGLRPGTDFNVRVLGLDPKDSADDAAAMKRDEIGDVDALSTHTRMLRGGAQDIARIAAVFGFHYIYDSSLDQYAHPAAVFTVTADGRIGHALSGLALDPADLRLAIVEAGNGRVGTVADHVRLLCYGFDPSRGLYNLAVGRALAVGGGVTVALLGGFLGFMFGRERWAR